MDNIYNSLPSILEAARVIHELEDDILLELSQLLTKYGLQSKFGISLVHRHFTLLDNTERIVDLRNVRGDTIVSSVFRNCTPDPQNVKNYNLDIPETAKVVGTLFLVRAEEVVPYEFSCVSENEATMMNQYIDDLDPMFMTEWAAVLDSKGLLNVFGLALSENGLGEGSIWVERSDVRNRVSVAYQGVDEEQQLVPSLWRITNNGGLVIADGCLCNYYCLGCGKTVGISPEGACVECGAKI